MKPSCRTDLDWRFFMRMLRQTSRTENLSPVFVSSITTAPVP